SQNRRVASEHARFELEVVIAPDIFAGLVAPTAVVCRFRRKLIQTGTARCIDLSHSTDEASVVLTKYVSDCVAQSRIPKQAVAAPDDYDVDETRPDVAHHARERRPVR